MGTCDNCNKKQHPSSNIINNQKGNNNYQNYPNYYNMIQQNRNPISQRNINIINQATIEGKSKPSGIKNEEKINEQMKKFIFKINVNNKLGTGFLCSVPFHNKYGLENLVPVLIINKSIINTDELLRLKKIDLIFDNDREEKTINITSERAIYSSKEYDITFIEIIPKIDEFKGDYLKTELEEINEKNNVYILQYQNAIYCSKLYGIIEKINGNNIIHNCTEILGGPILLLNNQMLIGINIGKGQGILLKEPIKEFEAYMSSKNDNNNKIMNCIDCYYTIKNCEEFYLLHDFNNNIISENIEINAYNEGKKKKQFLEENINIFIDSQPIKFNYKYKTNNNQIHVKFIFKRILIDLSFMFFECENLESIDLTKYDTTYITNMYCMFYGCSNLKSVDFSSLKSNNGINMAFTFSNCFLLKTINFPSNNIINITNLSYTFFVCKSLESLNLSSFNTIKVKDMNRLFGGCSALEAINISSFKTDNVIDMGSMFFFCHKLKSLDLSNFNTRNVEIMNDMFFDCRSLITLDLSSFNTINVKYMHYMFMGCFSLKSINLSSFNTINVVDMSNMFSGCHSLQSINLSSFNTINVTKMIGMFLECKSLKSLDLSSFKTPKLVDMGLMFNFCLQLESLDLSSFNTRNINKENNILNETYFLNILPKFKSISFDNIFFGCLMIKNIKCKDKYILEMFDEAKKLADLKNNI